MKKWFDQFICGHDGLRRQRLALVLAGLKEEKLRAMSPDDRVAALEKARLDPYDYIYLCC
ncbi:MAG: hypothetical protein IKC09_04985 [Oscillospiraceae bacterium]|nr:hypothetical protein [Oscillospiraceae bacterium]